MNVGGPVCLGLVQRIYSPLGEDLLTLRGGNYPLVVFLIVLGIVSYQLASGNLLSLSWRVWVTRKERPGTYWAMLAIEVAIVLIGLYLDAR